MDKQTALQWAWNHAEAAEVCDKEIRAVHRQAGPGNKEYDAAKIAERRMPREVSLSRMWTALAASLPDAHLRKDPAE